MNSISKFTSSYITQSILFILNDRHFPPQCFLFLNKYSFFLLSMFTVFHLSIFPQIHQFLLSLIHLSFSLLFDTSNLSSSHLISHHLISCPIPFHSISSHSISSLIISHSIPIPFPFHSIPSYLISSSPLLSSPLSSPPPQCECRWSVSADSTSTGHTTGHHTCGQLDVMDMIWYDVIGVIWYDMTDVISMMTWCDAAFIVNRCTSANKDERNVGSMVIDAPYMITCGEKMHVNKWVWLRLKIE